MQGSGLWFKGDWEFPNGIVFGLGGITELYCLCPHPVQAEQRPDLLLMYESSLPVSAAHSQLMGSGLIPFSGCCCPFSGRDEESAKVRFWTIALSAGFVYSVNP